MPKLTVDLELKGDQKYKQALAELNSGNRVLASEMKKLQAEYKGNADSVEFLNKKGDLLQRQLLQQRDKVQKLNEAVAWAQKEYGEASTKTQEYIVKLNNAQAAEFELEHAIEENNQALQGQNEEMVDLSDTVEDVSNQFGIRLPKAATDALKGMKSFSAGTVAAITASAAAIAGLIKAMKELNSLAIKYASEADDIVTQSAITGLSTTLIQQLQYAEPLIDVSVDTIMGSLTKLTKNIADAAGGNDKLAQSFRDLRVDFRDGSGELRSAQDVFFDLVDALGQMGNDTERDAAAMELLGKSAQELNPLIKQGTDTLRGYMAAADENFVLTEDQIEALAELDDQVEQNRLEWEALKKQLAAQFAPVAKEVMEKFGTFVKNAGQALLDSGLIDAIGNMLKLLMDMINPILKLFAKADEAPGKLAPVAEALRTVAYVLATIQDAISVIVGALTGNGDMIKTALGWNISKGQMSATQRVYYGNTESYGTTYNEAAGGWTGNYGMNAGGTDNWRGGLTWVGEAGPELVYLPRGSKIKSAQESAESVSNTYNITVNGIEQLDEIIRWYESRQVRARMA